jgi:hypothetical protein
VPVTRLAAAKSKTQLEGPHAQRSRRSEDQDGNARQVPPQDASQDAAIHWAERLRKVTIKAPLQSLFIAFLLGIWVARQR